jgi:phosphoribosylformimino-5-aminoimidazole carboxamide ribotide isomerase
VKGSPPPLVVPAVDVLDGEAVRLLRGSFASIAARGGDPLTLVRRYAGEHPALIHVVDLDGARYGHARPELAVAAAEAAGEIPIQFGGGVRSPGDALALVAAGAARVVVGTAAFASLHALTAFVDALGERLVVAVDVRDGRVAAAAWTEDAGLELDEALARCRAAGVPRLLCTAIDRDGTLAGPALGLLERVVGRAAAPVLAAGGVRTAADLDALATVGVEGAIVGRALLDGTLPLSRLATRERAISLTMRTR